MNGETDKTTSGPTVRSDETACGVGQAVDAESDSLGSGECESEEWTGQFMRGAALVNHAMKCEVSACPAIVGSGASVCMVE